MRHLSIIVHLPKKLTPDSPWHRVCVLSCSVMPNCLWPHGLQPTRESLQGRILEWVAMSSSRGSSQPRDQIQVSHIVGGFFTSWATREPWEKSLKKVNVSKVYIIQAAATDVQRDQTLPYHFAFYGLWILSTFGDPAIREKTQHYSVFQPCSESWNQQIPWISEHGTSSWET